MSRSNGHGPPPDPRDLSTEDIAASVTDAITPLFKSSMPPDEANEQIFALSDAVETALSPLAQAVTALSDRLDQIQLR